MEFWLIYRKEDVQKNQFYIESYAKTAPSFGMNCRLVFTDELTFGVENGEPCVKGPGQLPAFAIVRAIRPDISRYLEKCGVRCFNSAFVSEICNNKAYTYDYLSGRGIPMPDSVFIKNFELRNFLETCPQGKIIKAVEGHGGSQVILFDGNIEKTLDIMGKSDVVVQNRIGTKACDLRVYVLGKKILASVLRSSDRDFRANFSLGGDVRLYELSDKETELVYKIINCFDFDLVGIDFLLDDMGNLIFNEIEDVVGARMLYKCSDIDIVKEYLEYVSLRQERCRLK